MAVQTGAGGTVLAGTLTADAAFAPNIYQGSALFVGVGSLAASFAPINWAGSALFAGAGGLVGASNHFVVGRYDETGSVAAPASGIPPGAFTELEFGLQIDRPSLAAGDVLTFRVYIDGTPLDSYSVTPSVTIAATSWEATALFVGAGNLAVDATIPAAAIYIGGLFAGAGNLASSAQLLMMVQSALTGAGSLSVAPQLLMRATTAPLTAAGALIADLAKLAINWDGSALFAGTGQQTARGTLVFHAGGRPGLPDEMALAGAGTLSGTAKLLMRSQPPQYSAIGALAATPQLRMDAGVFQFGGAGLLTADSSIKGLITASGLFAGNGSLSVATRQRMAESFALFGEGQATITPRLRMRGSAGFAGAGLLVADLRVPEAVYQGSAILAGIGNFSSDAIRIINVTEEAFNSIGSLLAESSLFLPSDAVFGGEGLLSVEAQNQMFAEVAFGAFGSMRVDIQRYGSDAGRFICDLDADMTMGDLMAAISTGTLDMTTETNSLNTTIRCH